jgi:hypothetical protein
MTWLDGYRMRLVLVGFVAVIVLGGGSAQADFAFGEPMNLGPVVNSSTWDQNPSISSDGLSLYFNSNRLGQLGGTDLWVTTRESIHDPWGTPTNLGAPVNSSGFEFPCCISADGLELYFNDAGPSWGYVPRPGGYGQTDLWVSTRPTKNHAWGEPTNLGPTVNSQANDAYAEISSDGLTLYFDSDRSGKLDVDYQIWVTTRATKKDPWGEPVILGNVGNTLGMDGGPSISSDDLAFFFWSDRSGGYGSSDIYMMTRPTKDDAWGIPMNLGPMVNNAYSVEAPDISADGRTLYFCDYRPPRPGGFGITDIWQVALIPTVDFTGDSQVNIKDLLILIEHWGQNEPAYDMGPMPWGDGVVDAADLEVLMRYWGQEVYDPHLLACWKLDESEGDVAYDGAADNHAVVIGEAVWQPEGGQIDGALRLDGIDDYIDTLFELNPADGPFSIFAWIKGGAPGQVIMSQENGVDWLLTDTQGYLMTALQSSSGRIKSGPLISETIITDANWHRIGFIWDGTNRILYVDDIEVIRDTVTTLDSASGTHYIGAGSNLEAGTFWSGMIDDVRIYDRVVEP